MISQLSSLFVKKKIKLNIKQILFFHLIITSAPVLF